MSLLRNIASGLRSLFRKKQVDNELNEELYGFLEMAAEEKMKQGMSRKEALRAVRLERGSLEVSKEVVRSAGWESFVETCWQDLHFGLRMLRKSPGFTAVAVLTLAFGIGANAAIFSMVNALVLRPLPVHAPNEVASLASQPHGSGSSNGFSYPDFEDIRDQATSVFRDMTGMQPSHMDGFSMNGQSQPIWMTYVTTNFFQVMDLQPALGTFFEPSDGTIDGSEPVLVLSYSFWKNHMGGDPNIVGRSASINGRSVTIIGVAPEGFRGVYSILDTQGYLPVGMATATLDSPKDFLTNRSVENIEILGRLKPGMKVGQAQPVLAVVGRQLSEQYPEIHKWDWLQAFPGGPLNANPQDTAVIESMAAFFLLLVGLVLVLACMNVANLLLVRAAARQGEMAVRAAFGAGRGRLVRQLLTESLLLAALGCGGGIVVGVAASRLVNSINFASAIPVVFNVTFDWRVLAYAVGAALLTGVLVGVTPAVRTARGNLNPLLHESSRTASRRQRARSVLVVAELSGSMMLLIIAGLFVRSLRSVERSDLGFDPDHVLNLTISPTDAGYEEAQASQFLEQVLQRARALPAVESASLAATIPMGHYNYGEELKIEGYETPPGQQRPLAGYNAVSREYFRTMRIPLIRGRDFFDSDDRTSQNVAVVNEEMAMRYWPNQDPIGRHFTTGKDSTHPIQVIGVVKNSRTQHLTGSFRPYFYRPLTQSYLTPVTLQLRTALPAATAVHQAVDLIHSLAPAMPVFDVQTMTQALDTLNGLLLYQVGAALTASLGTLGLLLGLVGVYGVVSYAAAQRTHEIGIRMALGAARSSVLKMILRQGLILTAAGVLVGALLAGAIGRLARDLLAGVSPMDPLTYVCASGLLAAVSLLACYIPARRAMRVDPMVALRYE
jgi:macrolide transport system ATP-binding/permease protein